MFRLCRLGSKGDIDKIKVKWRQQTIEQSTMLNCELKMEIIGKKMLGIRFNLTQLIDLQILIHFDSSSKI